MPNSREAKVEFELGHLIKKILEKKNFTIEGVKFADVEPQYHVDSGRADLALLLAEPVKPILIIECKRKDLVTGGEISRNIDPTSSRVIDQALLYATRSGAPLFLWVLLSCMTSVYVFHQPR
jgi:hypothetical protein